MSVYESPAMKPADLPISLTMPTPLGRLQRASVLAETMAACAASTEVWKPKERSMRSTSLSMVFGMPTTAMFSLRSIHVSLMMLAPLCVPSPPITYSWLIPCFLRKA